MMQVAVLISGSVTVDISVSVRTIAVMVMKIATMGVMKMTAVGIIINGLHAKIWISTMYRIGTSLEGTILSNHSEASPRVVTEDSTRGRGAYPT